MLSQQSTLLTQGFSELLKVWLIRRVHPEGEIFYHGESCGNKEDTIADRSGEQILIFSPKYRKGGKKDKSIHPKIIIEVRAAVG